MDKVFVANGYRPHGLMPWQYDDPDGVLFICESLYTSPNSTTNSHKTWKRNLSLAFRRAFRRAHLTMESLFRSENSPDEAADSEIKNEETN